MRGSVCDDQELAVSVATSLEGSNEVLFQCVYYILKTNSLLFLIPPSESNGTCYFLDSHFSI